MTTIRKLLSEKEMAPIIDHWVVVANAAIDLKTKPWEPVDYQDGRRVQIDTNRPEVMGRLRFMYYEKGWTVYAMSRGQGLLRKYHLEFYPKPRLEI